MMRESREYAAKSDEDLVKLTLKNEDFLVYLIKRYEGRLKLYLMRISSITDEEAEDLLQEVFIKVYRNLNDFDQSLKFSSWIYRIAHNTAIDNYRKRQVRPQIINSKDSQLLLSLIEDKKHFKDEVERGFVSQKIDKILSAMRKDYREVLVLRFLEEKSYDEISDILSKPVGTVGTMLNRAKNEFRKLAKKFKIKFEI